MKRSLPVVIVIGAITAIFANVLQKRIEAARPVDTWEPVNLG